MNIGHFFRVACSAIRNFKLFASFQFKYHFWYKSSSKLVKKKHNQTYNSNECKVNILFSSKLLTQK